MLRVSSGYSSSEVKSDLGLAIGARRLQVLADALPVKHDSPHKKHLLHRAANEKLGIRGERCNWTEQEMKECLKYLLQMTVKAASQKWFIRKFSAMPRLHLIIYTQMLLLTPI